MLDQTSDQGGLVTNGTLFEAGTSIAIGICDGAMGQQCDGLCDVLCVLGAHCGEPAMGWLSFPSVPLCATLWTRVSVVNGSGLERRPTAAGAR